MLLLHRVRVGVLIFSILVASAVLALSAALIYKRTTQPYVYDDFDDDFQRHAIVAFPYHHRQLRDEPETIVIPIGRDIDTVLTTAIAIVTLLTVPFLLIADLFKRRTLLASVAVEATWLFILWILWLVCGAYTAWCSQQSIVNIVRCEISPSQCLQYKMLEALSFVNWINLMLYTNTLFTLAVINHVRRHPIWLSAVRDAPHLPPLVFAATPIPADEGKRLVSTSSFSLHHHPTAYHPPSHIYRGRPDDPSSTPTSPVLPSIEEGSQGPLVARPDPESILPPIYSEQPPRQ